MFDSCGGMSRFQTLHCNRGPLGTKTGAGSSRRDPGHTESVTGSHKGAKRHITNGALEPCLERYSGGWKREERDRALVKGRQRGKGGVREGRLQSARDRRGQGWGERSPCTSAGLSDNNLPANQCLWMQPTGLQDVSVRWLLFCFGNLHPLIL